MSGALLAHSGEGQPPRTNHSPSRAKTIFQQGTFFLTTLYEYCKKIFKMT